MDAKLFLLVLFSALIFLAVASAFETPVTYATGTIQLCVRNCTETHLLINGTEGDTSVQAGSNISIAVIVLGESLDNKNVLITMNGTELINDTLNSTNQLTHYAVFNTVGLYNITAFFAGDENHANSSASYLLTVTAAPVTPTPEGPTGGGGGGAVPAANITEEKKLSVAIISNDMAVIKGVNLDAGSYIADMSGAVGVAFTRIGFVLRTDVPTINAIIETVPKPEGLTAIEQQYGLEKPYQYVKMTVIGAERDAPFRTISANFRVSKEWITANNIDEGTITLYRYDGRWTPVSVVKTGENDDYSYFYAADLRALSAYFVVSGKGLITIPFIAPAYTVAPMSYLQLIVLLCSLILLFILAAKRRRKHKGLGVE